MMTQSQLAIAKSKIQRIQQFRQQIVQGSVKDHFERKNKIYVR